ncbi:PDZ domain-containing protein [Salinibacterium sp. SYSU T00001]|uniref:YlbL family protein n=1 Tax=Homoserinimonas sedimenticola TaxID=2986805 RepID=UPI0022359A3B|nr:PDZ domain-containing protein [Salinibacterium sedimenticola]MCW4386528.1 PDZ domain-containing protein [Salinibacterium sedimenticola]
MANSPERTTVPLLPPPDGRASSPAPTRRARAGWWFLVLALLGVVVLSFVPTPYVIQQPGPVYDTLGSVEIDGEATDLIEIDAETYETSGSLDLLTVNVVGSRATRTGWFSVVSAWLDPSRSVLPLDSVYPEGTSFEDAEEASRVDMENSKREAVAAALRELGYTVEGTLTIASVAEGYPADGVIEPGDTIVSVDGEAHSDVSALREALAVHGTESAAALTLLRDGETLEVEVTPVLSEGSDPIPVLGVGVQVEYDFPVDVDITLDSVGGPSAGMMFALGIVDKLSPGDATGGEIIAGTGTITATGEVGPIGGVRQKMYGALGAGADWMLVPSRNCSEVAGNEPSGLRVIPVETLTDALAALESISGGQPESLASCP